MKRKIITDNTQRKLNAKPTKPEAVDYKSIDDQLAKYTSKAVPRLGKPVVMFVGGPLNKPQAAVDDYQAAKAKAELLKTVSDASSLRGASIPYQGWKPGNQPSLADIQKMLQLLGSDPQQMLWASPTVVNKIKEQCCGQVPYEVRVTDLMPDDRVLMHNPANPFDAKQNFMMSFTKSDGEKYGEHG